MAATGETKTEYDEGAKAYTKVASSATRLDVEVEFYSFFLHTGPLLGKKVLDLACGSGRYARQIAERVGKEGGVVGLDLSEEIFRKRFWKLFSTPS